MREFRCSSADGQPSWQWQARLAGLLFLAVLIPRLPTFFRSVMDWDESLYFLMAEQWRAGHLPYTALWDNKPIGIYGVFALFQSGFGDNVISIRIASVVFTTVAAFAVFRIALTMRLGDPRCRRTAALFASVAYVVCSLTNDGLSANTEIFMACFSALAMLSALSGRGLLAGLLFGLAFMTKYVVVFEAPAIAFALLVLAPARDVRGAVKSGSALACGAALPLLATMALYAGTGHFHAWLEDSVLSNFRRVAVPVSMPALQYIFVTELLRWLPLFAISLAMLGMACARVARMVAGRDVPAGARYDLFLALWLVGGCVGVASAKSFFDHYFLQILPVMCVTLAWMLLTVAARLSRVGKAVVFGGILALPLVAAATAVGEAAIPVFGISHGRIIVQRDTPARIAQEIKQQAPGQIYVFDYQPIIYSLAGQVPPTKYAFPSVLTKCQLAGVAKVRAMHEVKRILAGNPEFIIRSLYPYQDPSVVNLRVYAALDRTLAARYALWRSYDDAAVYRLRDPGAKVSESYAGLPPACPRG